MATLQSRHTVATTTNIFIPLFTLPSFVVPQSVILICHCGFYTCPPHSSLTWNGKPGICIITICSAAGAGTAPAARGGQLSNEERRLKFPVILEKVERSFIWQNFPLSLPFQSAPEKEVDQCLQPHFKGVQGIGTSMTDFQVLPSVVSAGIF